MLSNNYPIKNYEDFKEMFVREDGRRKNAVLLAWYKSRPMMNWLRERIEKCDEGWIIREFAKGFTLRDMASFKDYILWMLGNHTDYEKSDRMSDSIWIPNRGWYPSDRCYTDRNGLCLDRDYRSYRYIRKKDRREFKMKMGRLFNHVIDCTTLAHVLPQPVRLWICEEVQRDWEAYARAQMPEPDGFELHVDDDFEKIYTKSRLRGEFGSCMSDRRLHTFYTDAVKAKAAYLTDEEGMIVARCVIFTECEDIKTGEVVRLAERQYSSDGKEVLKQDLITALIKGGHIDGYKKIGAGCSEANAFLSKDGESWSHRRFKISCDLDYGDPLSYQDSFKWYDMSEKAAYNWYEDCGEGFDLATTDGEIRGRNYDDWHERWTSNDLVTVYYRGRSYQCDEEDLDDFRWVDNGEDEGYFFWEEVSYCERCETDFVTEHGHYSEITHESYCCEDCRDEAEDEYKEENWTYSEYDDEWFEDEDDVVTLKRGTCDEMSISRDSADRLVDRGEAICINGKYYDAEWAECVLDEA